MKMKEKIGITKTPYWASDGDKTWWGFHSETKTLYILFVSLGDADKYVKYLNNEFGEELEIKDIGSEGYKIELPGHDVQFVINTLEWSGIKPREQLVATTPIPAGYSAIRVYVEANKNGEVTENAFWREIKNFGINPKQVIASIGDADQDGYDLTVLIKGSPGKAETISDYTLDDFRNGMPWPEGYDLPESLRETRNTNMINSRQLKKLLTEETFETGVTEISKLQDILRKMLDRTSNPGYAGKIEEHMKYLNNLKSFMDGMSRRLAWGK
jgi:hypothetical protein